MSLRRPAKNQPENFEFNSSSLEAAKNILTNYRFILFLSCVLEIFHLIIPNRAFEFYDLIANFTGVVIILSLNSFIKWRKQL